MKQFSTYITEAAIALPEFNHTDLKTPRDPNGRFWKSIEAANEQSIPRASYSKALNMAKDLYTYLTTLEGDDVKTARDQIDAAVKSLKKSVDSADEGMSSSDIRVLKNHLFIISGIDNAFKNRPWYKKARIDVKAGYVPFRGSAKDPKIKYRVLITLDSPLSDGQLKDIYKTIPSLSPIHGDFVAGIESNKEHTAVAILISNSQGYKR
jgi:hypothetical protein